MIFILSVDDESGLLHQCTRDPEERMNETVNRGDPAREAQEKTNMGQPIFKFKAVVSGSGQDCGLVFHEDNYPCGRNISPQYAGNIRYEYNDDDGNGKADMSMKSIID
jgi:hypothetical protein